MPDTNPAPGTDDAQASEGPDIDKIRAQRQKDIEKSSDLGLKRSAVEKALKERIRTEREERGERDQAAALAAAAKVEEKKEAKKEYRKENRRREQEILADKAREEAFKKHQQELKDAAEEKREKQKEYMHDLSEAGRIKYEKERAELALQQKKENLRAEANARAQTHFHEISREETHKKEDAEREAASRKGVIENEMRTKGYQLEALQRMQLDQLDGDIRSKSAALNQLRDQRQTQMQKTMLIGQAKVKRAHIEADAEKKVQALRQETQQRKDLVDAAYRTAVNAAEVEARHKRFEVQNKLSHELDEIEHLRK